MTDQTTEENTVRVILKSGIIELRAHMRPLLHMDVEEAEALAEAILRVVKLAKSREHEKRG